MQLKTSLWNKALFRNLSRNIMFLTVINIICTFILVPFSYFMMDVEGTNGISKYIIGSLNTSGLYFFGTIIYAILCGIFITYFFKSQNASDFIHSLPMRREEILSTVYGTYFIHVLVNLLVNGTITYMLGIRFSSINIEKVLIWMLLSMLMHLFIFSLTVLMSLLINNYLSHIIGVVALLISPVIMGTLIYTTHMSIFKGLSNYPSQFLNDITIPVKFMEYVVNDRYNVMYLFMILIVSLLMIIASYMIYRQRRNERINEAYANHWIHLIIYFITILTITLLGGLIFSSLFNDLLLVMLLIYGVAFTIAYLLMEMTAQKSVRISFDKKLFTLSLIGVALAVILVFVSGMIRERYTPDGEEVKSVAATFEDASGRFDGASLLNDTNVSDAQFIQNVIKAHHKLIQAQKVRFNNEQETRNIHLKYTLDNGRVVDRNYEVYVDDYNQYIKTVVTPRNKDVLINALDLSNHVNDQIAITHEISDGSYISDSLNKRQKEQLIDAIEETIKKRNQSVVYEEGHSKYSITFDYQYKHGAITESGSYEIPILLYDEMLIDFMKKESIIEKTSDLLPAGDVYELPASTDISKGIDDLSIEDIEGAKKVDRKILRQFVDNDKIDKNGDKLYAIDNTIRTFIYIK
ncbi:hypothetical protein [Macrococcoides caseolyticum]|uniref:hypothetical protein n=1 Tax=Macrococcoides caseolyticum TaxID=69966 RepID=UPI000C349412|nr:hypothetical protein [Macrococcus caseolyticus]MDJ1108879.1 hypothetical protein [Macrococcus caseolyticus]PKE19593.1 hypothetical protein CW679_04730 [Macrococcus caseolyticus]PKF41104.1 hypothetical protein CW661_04470 [Macrococcus caseolyticus]QYA35790.1 hypothetical protein KYI08_02605 [Macrococcus caseolyticus]QYA40485.1 hypothetical protein KYI09_02385 [Macrococcus caseolyticus]